MKPLFALAIGLASLPRPTFGLVGITYKMWDPICAHACFYAISSNALSCSSHEEMDGMDMDMGMAMTTPECRANDTSYLTTLAWCLHTRCVGIPTSKLEAYWEVYPTEDKAVAPKWDYGTSLYNVNMTQPPTRELGADDMLNFTAVVPDDAYDLQFRTLEQMVNEETIHARYGVALLVTGFATPIFLTWMGYLPYMTGLLDKIRPYLVYPSLIGTYHVRPLPYLLGNAPTVGQGLYIALFLILNIVLSAVNFRSAQPSAWYTSRYQEIMAWIFYRTGVFSFALAPLVILFAGRNNILLWMTNWSHSTYLLLHRWIARIYTIQVLIHSITGLVLYQDMGTYSSNLTQPYWIWGAVATVAICVLLLASVLPIRRWSYEVFLITHVVLNVFVVVGSWYHVYLRFGTEYDYVMWMYTAIAVWFFDRLVRVMRIGKNGMRRAKVVDVGDGYVRVDVEGIRWSAVPGQHVYAYFPTLNPLRPWENHPFSVLPTAMLQSPTQDDAKGSEDSQHESEDVEKHGGSSAHAIPAFDSEGRRTTAGLTLFIKKSTGMTKYLKAENRLLTLLDGPYPNNSTASVLQCDRVLLIGGGIGITSLLPWLNSHPNVKLY
ncbi:hypothetical protein VNI00_015691 [Paramarasmius palmivorus]|uniref:FAD-binding FR-type domain-containing protein n=1 Tax=Paramarasmius palmivorus TaxID=297713 RepID=A0AAW0BK19_9AGAR